MEFRGRVVRVVRRDAKDGQRPACVIQLAEDTLEDVVRITVDYEPRCDGLGFGDVVEGHVRRLGATVFNGRAYMSVVAADWRVVPAPARA